MFRSLHGKILILFLVITSVSAVSAFASNSVLMGNYQIQLFIDPDPIVAERSATITIKVLRSTDKAPVRGGKILLSTGETLREVETGGLDLKDISGFREAREVDEFGNYELETTFRRPEPYYLRLAITALEGKTIDPPLMVGFSVPVGLPENSFFRLLFLLFVLTMITFGGIYLVHIRAKLTSVDANGLNFLDIPWVKRLFHWKYIQPLFQIPLAIFFITLIVLSITDIQDSGKNLATILIWTIWWAGIIFTFVLVGRLWCFACPVGAFSEWTSRILKPKRHFPARLRNLWLANLTFVLLTWLDIQLGVVRNPIVTGALLIGITAIAFGVATLYQRRSFCRYLCPIGGLIGIYSMFSAVELRSKDYEVCKNHRRKDCYLGNERGYGCPMFELVPKMDSNNLCTFCGECIKSCPKNNITIRARPFFKDAWTTGKRTLDEAALAVVLVGVSIFVTGDMLEPWAGWIESAMNLVPAKQLGIEYEYTIEVVTKSVLYFSVSLLIIPALMLLTALISNRIVGKGNHRGLKQTFMTFGYMFIPIGLSMHLAHNIGHLLNESGKIIPALKRVINKYTPFYTGEPDWILASQPLIDSTVTYWIQMGLFLMFYIFSMYAGYRLALIDYEDSHTAFQALIPMVAFSFILMVVNVYLLNLPMAPRHVH
jgi:polyferredoxin